jgi:hypothetical protein
MTWTVTNLLIELIAGILGGNVAALLSHEHSFGVFGHSMAGAAAGGVSGYFLQTFAGTVLNGGGAANVPDPVTQVILQSLTGFAAGAILTLIVGFIKHSIDQNNT